VARIFADRNQVAGPPLRCNRAGNVTNDGIHSYSYDAEGRIIQVDAGQTALYYYDGFGHRVRKIAGGVTRDFLYDLAGHIYQEVDGTIAAKTDLYTPGGFHLGSYADGTTYFSHANWLGTELLRTGPTGSVLWSCSGSLPFGDGASCSGNVGSYVNGISGLRLDFETGLAAAAYRDYSATSGRWLTPDPAGLAAVDPSNPQTWNRYAYVTNNPVNFTDPLGLGCSAKFIGPCPADRQPGAPDGPGDPTYDFSWMPPSSRGPYYTVSEYKDKLGDRRDVPRFLASKNR
jgi:RHS repeat-associated protein